MCTVVYVLNKRLWLQVQTCIKPTSQHATWQLRSMLSLLDTFADAGHDHDVAFIESGIRTSVPIPTVANSSDTSIGLLERVGCNSGR